MLKAKLDSAVCTVLVLATNLSIPIIVYNFIGYVIILTIVIQLYLLLYAFSEKIFKHINVFLGINFFTLITNSYLTYFFFDKSHSAGTMIVLAISLLMSIANNNIFSNHNQIMNKIEDSKGVGDN